MTAPLVYTVPEVAALLRCSTDSVYAMCNDGTLDHRRIGRRKIIVPRRAVLAFLGEEDAPNQHDQPEHDQQQDDGPAGAGGAVVVPFDRGHDREADDASRG